MTPVTFHLRDCAQSMVDAWLRYFEGHPEVRPAVGDIFGEPVDTVVSPANCFGFMNGGIDRAYTQRFGQQLETRLRERIRSHWDGEMPVGVALAIETGAKDVPTLICAPTLRAPVSVAGTLNAYLAFRAVLRIIQRRTLRGPAPSARSRAPAWEPEPARCRKPSARSRCTPRIWKWWAASRLNRVA